MIRRVQKQQKTRGARLLLSKTLLPSTFYISQDLGFFFTKNRTVKFRNFSFSILKMKMLHSNGSERAEKRLLLALCQGCYIIVIITEL